MPDETSTPPSAEQRTKERDAFNKVAEVMETLGQEARLRLLRLLLAHFDLPIANEIRSLSSQAMGSPPQPSSFSEDRALTPKQFMIQKKPHTDVERVACLAYYLTHYRDQQHFKTLDLSKLNTEAAQVKFSNAAKAVDNASANGFLSQVGGGRKQLSANGELYVQALPDREAARAAMAHVRPRRRSNKSKDEITAEEE
jgi:hypothetical protein